MFMEVIIEEDPPKGMPLSSRNMLYVVAIIAPLLDTMPITSTIPLNSSSSWEIRNHNWKFNTTSLLTEQWSIPLDYLLVFKPPRTSLYTIHTYIQCKLCSCFSRNQTGDAVLFPIITTGWLRLRMQMTDRNQYTLTMINVWIYLINLAYKLRNKGYGYAMSVNPSTFKIANGILVNTNNIHTTDN